MNPSDLLTLADIARRLDRNASTVRVWHHRGELPEPAAKVAGVNVWTAEQIDTWAAKRFQA